MKSSPSPPEPMTKRRVANGIILSLYILLLGSLAAGLWRARNEALNSYTTSQSQEDWQRWRLEAKIQHERKGPVTRRVPKSQQPPTLVLLRDHFITSAAVLLVLSSALYFAFALLVRGVLTGPRFEVPSEDEKGSGGFSQTDPRLQ